MLSEILNNRKINTFIVCRLFPEILCLTLALKYQRILVQDVTSGAGKYSLSCRYNYIKGTHTIYFSSSLYIKNQKPLMPRTHFHCITTWVARSCG